MRVLVLGGSGFVGRSVVDEGLALGWEVTVLNRGTRPHPDGRVVQLVGDRTRDPDLPATAGRSWDVVVDTWSGAPSVVARAARALEPLAGRYVYVSSCSVYPYPPTPWVDETATPVDADPEADDGDYATNKRGGELAALAAFGDRALLPRPGLILGPHEDVGRLPWWLLRIDRGGEVLAPGPAGLELQHVDARDLARWMLIAARDGRSGPYNVVGPPDRATTDALLQACITATGSDAVLRWVDAADVEAAGIAPWSELPIWIPPGDEARGLHEIDARRVADAGLVCRPLEETVRDTWAWILDQDRRPRLRTDRDPPGLAPEKERRALRR